MARIEHHEQISTPLPPAEAHARLLNTSAARGAQMAFVTHDYLEGRTGSQAALRLKGGWLAKLEEFPVVAAVQVVPAPTGALVRLTVADDLGFGLKAGMNKKYRQAVEQLARALVGAVAAAPLPARHCPGGHPQPTHARFCGSCGAQVA
jgi:hypothetical protein